MRVKDVYLRSKNFVQRNLFIRGRYKQLVFLLEISALRKILKRSQNLHWYGTDNSGVLMRIEHSHNFSYLLKSQRLGDSMPVAVFLQTQFGKVAIDVGANRGYLSVAMSRQFEHVFAFEPDESNRQKLLETLEVNQVKNVQIFNSALSNVNGSGELRYSTSHGHHTLEADHLTKSIGKQPVVTQRLDDFAELNQITSIDLLKIDVEGHELSVLRGAEKLLREMRIKSVIFEHSLALTEVQSRSPFEVFDLLISFGFEIWTLDNQIVARNEMKLINQADLLAQPRS